MSETSRLESLGPDTLDAFVAAPVAVLMLAKGNCEHCAAWTEELTGFLDGDGDAGGGDLTGVRFGKLRLDQRGLVAFKRANPWLADVDVLPTNLLYVDGELVKRWAGGGLPRLLTRLRRVTA